jgi:squalene synthase HpnC
MSATAAVPTRQVVMAQAQDENFPVASVLLGRRQRARLLALYGVARLIDDIGDEAAGDRDALLDWVDRELDRVFAGESPEHPAMRALAVSVGEHPLPPDPFRRLVQANRQDQSVTSYQTFDELLGYCRLSAAPVGELVLHAFSAATSERLALSERICAGLQVTEHIQDVAEDYTRGRVYIPREDLARFRCDEADLASSSASPELRAVVAFEVERARALLREGAPLARGLPARPRAAVAGFIAGGRAALESIERSGYDVCGTPAPRTRRAFAAAFAGALMGR